MSANLLGEASDVLNDAVDLEVALEGVAQLTVPAVADFCAIDVLSPDGVLTRVAVPRERGVPWARSVDIWFPSDPEGEHPIANVLRGGRPELVADVRTTRDVMANRRHAGEPTPYSYLVVPLVARGKTLGVLSLVSWIPGRRYRIDDLVLAGRLARQLALAVDNRQLGAGIGQFLAALSHDLRTPLTAMLGWITLLRHHDLSAAQVRRGLDVLDRNTRLQARLLDDLLELTPLRSDAAPLDRRPVDMVAVVRDTVTSVGPDATAKSIEVRADLDSPSGFVVGDPLGLRQLVASVVSMAISETPAGGSIAVRLARPSPASVCLTVRGRERVVPPSASLSTSPRVAGARGRPPGSRGVRLILARRLVELHGGTLQISRDESETELTVRIDLPAGEAADSDELLTRLRPDPPESGASTLMGRRVLVIEDDRDTREFLRLSLERRGAVVRAAGSGAEALWLLDRGPIDVVLSDLTMPEGDGYSVIRAIRARGLTRLPAIALSALSGPAERARSAAAGFTEHLAKPIDPDHLARCLARVVRETESA